jgi:hypothetical protein
MDQGTTNFAEADEELLNYDALINYWKRPPE